MLSGTDDERILCDALSHLSSEDIEVFHSVLRGATHYQDSEAQIARKALMVTSRPTSPPTVLKRWSDLTRAVQEDEQTKKEREYPWTNFGRAVLRGLGTNEGTHLWPLCNPRSKFQLLHSPWCGRGNREEPRGVLLPRRSKHRDDYFSGKNENCQQWRAAKDKRHRSRDC